MTDTDYKKTWHIDIILWPQNKVHGFYGSERLFSKKNFMEFLLFVFISHDFCSSMSYRPQS